MKTIRRRRKENKTDYKRRRKLLQSEKPRVVFRRTNKYLISQLIISKEAQDKIEIGLSTKNLLSYGWPKEFLGSLKSTSASYLLGLLTGKKVIKNSKETPIVDFGMIRMIHKNRNYAFLKGLIDSGLDIKCNEEFFPEEDRIKGKNLKEDFSKQFELIKNKIEKE